MYITFSISKWESILSVQNLVSIVLVLASLSGDLNLQGINAFRSKNFVEASACYKKALTEAENDGDQRQVYSVLSNLKLLFETQGNADELAATNSRLMSLEKSLGLQTENTDRLASVPIDSQTREEIEWENGLKNDIRNQDIKHMSGVIAKLLELYLQHGKFARPRQLCDTVLSLTKSKDPFDQRYTNLCNSLATLWSTYGQKSDAQRYVEMGEFYERKTAPNYHFERRPSLSGHKFRSYLLGGAIDFLDADKIEITPDYTKFDGEHLGKMNGDYEVIYHRDGGVLVHVSILFKGSHRSESYKLKKQIGKLVLSGGSDPFPAFCVCDQADQN